MKKTLIGGIAAVAVAGGLALAAPAHATKYPATDTAEEMSTCAILSGVDKHVMTLDEALGLALTGVMDDNPGMSKDEGIDFVWKAIDDYCPKYGSMIHAQAH